MNRYLLMVVGVLAMAWGCRYLGYQAGHADGTAAARAECHASDVARLTGQLAAVSSQVDDAAAASRSMRQILVGIQAGSQKSTQEIRDALERTRGERLQCVLDADSLRLLTAAATRAADRAAGGLRNTVPGASDAQ